MNTDDGWTLAEAVMRLAVLFWCAVLSTSTAAAPLPYDASADAKAAVRQALIAAAASHVPVLILFGANWCPDCRALDRALRRGKSADLVSRAFKLVKVDVGNFDRNLDLVAIYGNPIKHGIPAAVVLSSGSRILYSTKAGELANARRMSESGIYELFKRASVTATAGN